MTHDEAVAFVIAKISSEAEADGVALTSDEVELLRFSEIDPARPDADELERKSEARGGDARLVVLLRRRYLQDLAAAPSALDDYRAARRALRHSDHYLLVIVDEALRTHLRSPVMRSIRSGSLVVTLLLPAVFLLYLALALGRFAFEEGWRGAVPGMLVVFAFGLMAFFLIRLWMRER